MPAVEEPESAQLFGKRMVRGLMLPLCIAVVAYAALLLYGDAGAVAKALAEIPLSALALAFAAAVASFAVRWVRWQLYLSGMGIRVLRRDSIIIFLSGLAMSVTPGKLGELLKSLQLKERYDVPVARSAPIVIAERLMDLVALLMLGLCSLGAGPLPGVTVVGGAAAIGLFYAFGRSRYLGALAIRVATLLPRTRVYREKLVTAHESLRELWGVRLFVPAFVLSLGTWALQAYTLIVFAGALDHRLLGIGTALVAYAAPLLAGALALLPGGLGLTEASMAGVLRATSGMAPVSAAAVTILTRLVTFWFALGIGFSALLVWRGLGRHGKAFASERQEQGRLDP